MIEDLTVGQYVAVIRDETFYTIYLEDFGNILEINEDEIIVKLDNGKKVNTTYGRVIPVTEWCHYVNGRDADVVRVDNER